MRPLNLATRPFRNEALPALLFGLAAAVVLLATVQHVLVLQRLLSGSTTALHQEVAGLEQELVRLQDEVRVTRVATPDRDQLARWTFLKDLVDRRTFSWTTLLSQLEDVLPPGVRVQAIAPDVKGGRVRLEVSATARSSEDGLAFVSALEARPEFADVYPLSVLEGEGGEGEFRYTMRYIPGAPAAPASETGAKGEGAVEGPGAEAAADDEPPPEDDAPPEDEPSAEDVGAEEVGA